MAHPKRKTINLKPRQLLKKLGLRPKDVIRIWYHGEQYQHGISFDRDDVVYFEITVQK